MTKEKAAFKLGLKDLPKGIPVVTSRWSSYECSAEAFIMVVRALVKMHHRRTSPPSGFPGENLQMCSVFRNGAKADTALRALTLWKRLPRKDCHPPKISKHDTLAPKLWPARKKYGKLKTLHRSSVGEILESSRRLPQWTTKTGWASCHHSKITHAEAKTTVANL
jgi:hypothetical protein